MREYLAGQIASQIRGSINVCFGVQI
jgi:hypothetical protein